MIRALVLGGARCMWRDVEKARSLASFDLVIACNSAYRDWPGQVDHAVSFHAELLPHWTAVRQEAGRPDAGAFWTARGHVAPPGLPMRFVEQWGGSSGLLAAQVAMEVAERAVLCGIPLDPDDEHFDRRGPWPDAVIHRRAWEAHRFDLVDKVRSMSGWTRNLLGPVDDTFLYA